MRSGLKCHEDSQYFTCIARRLGSVVHSNIITIGIIMRRRFTFTNICRYENVVKVNLQLP